MSTHEKGSGGGGGIQIFRHLNQMYHKKTKTKENWVGVLKKHDISF